MTQGTFSPFGNFFRALIVLALLCSCTNKDLEWIAGSNTISGTFVGYGTSSLSTSAVTLSCGSPQASLYRLDTNGNRLEPAVSTVSVAADGTYSFNAKSFGIEIKKQTPVDSLLVVITGCTSNVYFRPVTGAKEQDVTMGSSLLGYLANTSIKDKLAAALITSSEGLNELFAVLASAASLQDAYQTLSTNATLTTQFTQIFGSAPSVLLEAFPEVLESNIPTTALELSALNLNVDSVHWSATYTPAYEWKVDGVTKSSTSILSWTPGANDQGAHVVTVIIGKDDGLGMIDSAKPTHVITKTVMVANTTLPTPPSFTVTSPTFSGSTPIATRSLTLGLVTGTDRENCASFSSLALTETNFAPQTSDFTILCSQDGTQNENFTLTSSGDGAKTIYLWAKDSSDMVSLVPSLFSLNLDTQNPYVTIATNPLALSNSDAPSFTFTADDHGGTIDHFECKLDAAAYAPCTSPHTYSAIADGSHTFAVKAIDTAGNESTPAIYTWNIDLILPTVTITTPTSNGSIVPASQLGSYTVEGTCSEEGLIVTLAGASTETATCTSGEWSATIDISARADGTLSLTASQTDAAGNVRISTARTFVKDVTAPAIVITNPGALKGNSSSGAVTWKLTEANVATSTNFSLELYDGSSWISLGTKAAMSGVNSNQSYTFSGFTVPGGDINTAKIRISLADAAGNAHTEESGTFIIDSTPPTLSSVSINNGTATTLSAAVTVKVNATDDLAGVSFIRLTDAVGSDCQASYADNNWQSFTNDGGTQSFSYVTGFSNGIKQICAWAKDAVGNISQITANSGMGAIGVDMSTIRLDQGSPPQFTSLSVTNGNAVSPNYGTTTFANGDAINITFTVTDDTALATYPVSVYVTTDNSTYTQVVSYTTMGTPGGGQTTWTKTYSGYTAPTTSYFRLRMVALDANGNTSQVSSGTLNTGKWSVFAGNSDIGDGASALAARLKMGSVDLQKNVVAVNLKNEIFVGTFDGIRKIDPTTGNITTYLKCGIPTGIPGTVNGATRIPSCSNDLVIDGNDLYIHSSSSIYLVDTTTDAIKLYLGGGTSVTTTDPADLRLWGSNGTFTIDPVKKDIYLVNSCNAAFMGGTSYTETLKIQKVTQNTATKTPLAVSDVAGNCVKGNPVSGNLALQSPLEGSYYFAAHGSLVYVPGTDALYFAPYGGTIIKIMNGYLYRSSSEFNLRGGIYIPSQNKVYYSATNKGVFTFTPTASASFDETITKYINDETSCVSSNCRDDGVSLNSVGVYSCSVFGIGGQLGVVDNFNNNGLVARLRVVDSTTNSLQTLAGTDRFSGAGADRTLARFAAINDLIYKPTATGTFSAGIYAADIGASRILSMDLATNTVVNAAGSGLGLYATTGVAFDNVNSLGPVGTNSNNHNLANSPSGYFTFQGTGITNVNSSVVTERYLANGGSGALTMPEGSTLTTYGLAQEWYDGLLYDGAGNLYFGGYNGSPANGGSNYNRIKVRKANGAFYTVVGTDTNDVSLDCTTPGCAHLQSIKTTVSTSFAMGVNRLGRPYDDRYNAGEGRLLFAEGNTIRYVSRAYDQDNAQLGTLKTQAGVNINLTRGVNGFTFTYVNGVSEQIDKIYYLSSGLLYCYKVSTGTDPNCTNTTFLGPTAGMGTLLDAVITTDASGNIYVVNSTQNSIFKYTP